MKLVLAATLVFALVGQTFAGDLTQNGQFQLDFSKTLDAAKLGQPNKVPLVQFFKAPGYGFENPQIDFEAIGHEDTDGGFKIERKGCPTCIINPLDPLPDDTKINVTPDPALPLKTFTTLAADDPADWFRQAVAKGGNDSDYLGCNKPLDLKPSNQGGQQKFSARQFPEVVKLEILQPDRPTAELCTGTIVGADWVLTAAHCITSKKSAEGANNALNRPIGGDFVFDPASEEHAIKVIAQNSALNDVDKVRYGDRAIVHRLYDVDPSSSSHDIALVHLPQPFDPKEFPGATLSTEFDAYATLAGYGISNTAAPIGKFYVTMPPPLIQDGEHLTFVPTDYNGAFCQGDSGGPVYVGTNRGCQPTDLIPEGRPRRVEGVISYNVETSEDTMASSCVAATNMASQNVTAKETRDWICETSGSEINGCKAHLDLRTEDMK
ncbi:trypsin-like serine protease [Mesorhizobium newzealandense]|uniref:Trypsin-like serine protease n=1 Tax=Mesorhizobium newzealandense TaxID=1300302 RepID=A0ABW4UEH4_9HYPH